MSRIKGGKFNPSKHPRGAKGRFRETPDSLKTNKQLLKGSVVGLGSKKRSIKLKSLSREQKLLLLKQLDKHKDSLKALKDSRKLSDSQLKKGYISGTGDGSKRSLKLASMSREQKLLLLKQLDANRDKLVALAATKKPKKAKLNDAEKAQAVLDKDKLKADKLAAKEAKKQADLANKTKGSQTLTQDQAITVPEIYGTTAVRIVNNKVEFSLPAPDPTFRVEVKPDYEYAIYNKGDRLVLNNNKKAMYFRGDVVEGVPDLRADYTKSTNDEVLTSLKESVNGVKKGNAPQWDVKEHGQVVDASLVHRDGHGGIQIHHVSQWAKIDPVQSQQDVIEGRKTEDQHNKDMVSNLRPDPRRPGKYEIDVQPQGERKFVAIAGGLHEAQTPLYFANHPFFKHPVTGKNYNPGIPKALDAKKDKVSKDVEAASRKEARADGESREWFSGTFRNSFWKEYYKDQLGLIEPEIKDRLKSGKMSIKEIERLITPPTQPTI